MIEQGYIKLYRKFKDWEWYTNINVKVLFLHCLIRANHKSVKYQGIQIDRGEFMTSIRTLSIETGLSERQVRTALDKLILTSELTSKSNNKYRIIKVLKYNDYQENDKQDNKQLTNKRQTFDKPLTTNKNDKKEKNDKNRKDIVEEVPQPRIPYQKIISYLNQKIGTSYKSTSKETQKLIKARFNQGFTLENFYIVIDNKYDDWFKTDMCKFLRPTTLFGNKFESYLNQVKEKRTDKSKAVRDNLFRGTKYAN